MAKIVVDGNEFEVNPNNNLLQECLSLGLDLPYFVGIRVWVLSGPVVSVPSNSIG